MKGNQAAIIQRLRELETEDGRLTPEAVIEDARQPNSPLHGEFEWDLSAAAYQHWLYTARRLISMTIRVVSPEGPIRVPLYVRDPAVPNTEQGYRATMRVRDEKALAREVVADELSRVIAAINRARHVAGALGMLGDFEVMLEYATRARQRITEMTQAA